MQDLLVRELVEDRDLRAAWPLMWQLRPHLGPDAAPENGGAFVDAVRSQRADGYRLAGLFEHQTLRALAGFRIVQMLSRGCHMYVDDLVTDAAHRGTGAGKRMFAWLVAEARRCGCARLHLDSGVQRHAAHAFYFARRMHIQAHHFAVDLAELA